MSDRTDDLIDEETVVRLAQLAGIEVDPERRAAVAVMLQDMMAFTRELDALDLTDVEPAARYEPSWSSNLLENLFDD